MDSRVKFITSLVVVFWDSTWTQSSMFSRVLSLLGFPSLTSCLYGRKADSKSQIRLVEMVQVVVGSRLTAFPSQRQHVFPVLLKISPCSPSLFLLPSLLPCSPSTSGLKQGQIIHRDYMVKEVIMTHVLIMAYFVLIRQLLATHSVTVSKLMEVSSG